MTPSAPGRSAQVVKIKQRKWLFWPTYYTEDAVKEDTDRLRDFYYNQGFLDHKITSQTEFTGDGAKVHVIFIIEEGPVYHVSDIVFTGQTRYTAEQLRAKVKVREGDVYKKPKVDRDAREVVQLYREQGYVDADGSAERDVPARVGRVSRESHVRGP